MHTNDYMSLLWKKTVVKEDRQEEKLQLSLKNTSKYKKIHPSVYPAGTDCASGSHVGWVMGGRCGAAGLGP